MLLKSLLRLVVKQDKLEACKHGYQIKNLNLNDKHILLPLKDMEMGFEVEKVLRHLLGKDVVTLQQGSSFKSEAQSLIVTMIHKLFVRTPLASAVARCCSIFEPTAIVDKKLFIVTEVVKTTSWALATMQYPLYHQI